MKKTHKLTICIPCSGVTNNTQKVNMLFSTSIWNTFKPLHLNPFKDIKGPKLHGYVILFFFKIPFQCVRSNA